jgi:hypothetical protein
MRVVTIKPSKPSQAKQNELSRQDVLGLCCHGFYDFIVLAQHGNEKNIITREQKR